MYPEVFRQLLQRPPAAHKYDFGHVLVVGGSPGMVGAPYLAARAALRIGAGLVTIASAPPVVNKLEKRVAEIMTLRLSSDAHELRPFIKERKVSVLVVGPGLQPAAAVRALTALSLIELPLVIDGGGLSALQQQPKLIRPGLILTPHFGEFQRFLEKKISENEIEPAAAAFARQQQLILVAKGHPTFICSPEGEVKTEASGGPELATAGTGDVLAGMISGLIAQKIAPLQAAQAAVYLHAQAGKLAAAAKTAPGVIAGDVIEAIPAALKLVADAQV